MGDGAKWKAKLNDYYGGLFDNEGQAAMKVNLLCDELGIERKNPIIDIELDTIHPCQNHTSIYRGVSWNNNAKKWQAELTHNKKQCYGGLFDNEEHAAMKVNLLCDRLGIKYKNPMIDIEPDKIQTVHKSSQYIGVSWIEDRKGWKAQMMNNKKQYCGGYFDNEEDAAMKINLFC